MISKNGQSWQNCLLMFFNLKLQEMYIPKNDLKTKNDAKVSEPKG